MIGAHSSAGVYDREVDNSFRVQGVASSIAAIVGPSHRGPTNTRTLVTNGNDFKDIFGKPDARLTFMHYCALAFLDQGSRLYVTRVAVNATLGGVFVRNINNFSEVVPFTSGVDSLETVNFSSNDILAITAENPGTWNQDISVLLYPDVNDLNNEKFVLQVFEGSNIAVESYTGILGYATDGYGKQLNIEEQVNNNSDRIRIRINKNYAPYVSNERQQFINALTTGSFAGGSNGDPVTDGDIINAWNLYEDREEIDVNLLINAGYTNTAVQQKMTEIAEIRADAIAILDAPSDRQGTQDIIEHRRNTLNIDSSYSAMYTPDLYVADEDNGLKLYIPPSGHVAGAYAYTDSNFELWFAPAGMRRGVLNVLSTKVNYDLGARDALADSQINVIRNIKGGGIVIWGADTLQFLPSALSNINVRRLVSYIRKSVSLSVLFGVYEPNDPQLWAQLVSVTERFLNPIKRGRGLYWFEVVCDERNNKPDTIANGDVILDAYIDPVLPAKRIHIRAIIPPTGAIDFAVNLINNQ